MRREIEPGWKGLVWIVGLALRFMKNPSGGAEGWELIL
jgi:hypothetical protein